MDYYRLKFIETCYRLFYDRMATFPDYFKRLEIRKRNKVVKESKLNGLMWRKGYSFNYGDF